MLLLLFPLSYMACSARKPATPTGLQRTVIDAAGHAHIFTVWEAERVVKGPLMDLPSNHVRWEGGSVTIHDGEFECGLGGLRLSPDRTAVLLERHSQGCAKSGCWVDLATGAGTWTQWGDRLAKSWASWPEYAWRTALELVTREELHQRLSSGDAAAARAALTELEIRCGFHPYFRFDREASQPVPPAGAASPHPGFPDGPLTAADQDALARAGGDARLPEDVRRQALILFEEVRALQTKSIPKSSK